jgi:glucokinase
MANSAKHFIGVDLGGTNVRAGLVGSQKVLKLAAQTIRSKASEREVFHDLCSAIDSVIDGKIHGVGLGVPSLVDVKTGTILNTVNIPSWQKVPLKKWLEKKYKVPVRIDNDANCFALGERHFGLGKKCENFVGLVAGTGLGSGIVANGKLVSGRDCGAGEFGMLPYRDSILEHYASGQFFQRFNWDGATLAAEAANGNTKALVIFAEFGKHLAHAVKTVLFTLAPEMIILGGSVSQSYPFFENSLREELSEFAYPSLAKNLKLRTSKLKDVAVLGAASLFLE